MYWKWISLCVYVCMHSWSHSNKIASQWRELQGRSYVIQFNFNFSISKRNISTNSDREVSFLLLQIHNCCHFFRAYTHTHTHCSLYLLLLLYCAWLCTAVIANNKYSPFDCRCQTFEAEEVFFVIYISKLMKVFLLPKPLLFHFFQLFLLCTEERHRPTNTLSLLGLHFFYR